MCVCVPSCKYDSIQCCVPSSPHQSGEGALETDDRSAVREVKLAYENVKVVDCLDLTPEGSATWEAALKDCLDLSPEGSAAWEAALKRYDERIYRLETRIAARLRDVCTQEQVFDVGKMLVTAARHAASILQTMTLTSPKHCFCLVNI